MRTRLLSAIIGVLIVPQLVKAEDSSMQELLHELRELRSEVKDLKKTVQTQDQQIQQLQAETKTVSASPPPESAPPPAAASQSHSVAPFVPDIGAVADLTAQSTESKEDEDGNDKFSVRELELVVGHDIDPYSRFDSTITFSDFEDVDVEEAYVSYWALPFETKGRFGRMRNKIGFASAVHRDSLDTFDDPLVVQEYLGAEGLFRTGVELSHFLPSAGDLFTHELTLGAMEGGVGEGGTLLGDSRRHPSYYGFYRTAWDFSDVTNADLASTYLLGSSDDDSSDEVQLFGVHGRLKHNFNNINALKLQAEAYLQDRDEQAAKRYPFGWYGLADYRISERFGAGLRFDQVEPTNGSMGPSDYDLAYTGYLTFFQSEFARLRAQYQYVDFADGGDDDRFFLQGTFAIGTHKHQLQ